MNIIYPKKLMKITIIKSYMNRLKELKDNINKFTLRETKASSELNLPEKNYKRIEVDMDREQRRIYEAVKEKEFIKLQKIKKLKLKNLIL